MSDNLGNIPKGRQAELASYVIANGHVTVRELAKKFDVSPDTIRRDLRTLDDQGIISRAHGGAMRRDIAPLPDSKVDVRLRFNVAEKSAIARAAAEYIENGSTLIVNAGSTTLKLARALSKHRDLTIATNSVRLPPEIDPRCYRNLYMFGGEYYSPSEAIIGPIVLGNLDGNKEHSIIADYAIISVGGIQTSGYYTSNLSEASVMAAMIDNAENTIILADSSKFNRKLFTRIAPLDASAVVFTDSQPPRDIYDALQAAGVELVVCDSTP